MTKFNCYEISDAPRLSTVTADVQFTNLQNDLIHSAYDHNCPADERGNCEVSATVKGQIVGAVSLYIQESLTDSAKKATALLGGIVKRIDDALAVEFQKQTNRRLVQIFETTRVAKTYGEREDYQVVADADGDSFVFKAGNTRGENYFRELGSFCRTYVVPLMSIVDGEPVIKFASPGDSRMTVSSDSCPKFDTLAAATKHARSALDELISEHFASTDATALAARAALTDVGLTWEKAN